MKQARGSKESRGEEKKRSEEVKEALEGGPTENCCCGGPADCLFGTSSYRHTMQLGPGRMERAVHGLCRSIFHTWSFLTNRD